MPGWTAIMAAALGAGGAVWGLHRLALWMEGRGWIYYRKKAPGGLLGNAMQEMQAILQPGARQSQQVAKEEQARDADRQSAGDDGGERKPPP